MVECPSCDEEFGSKGGRNIHHKMVHGESLAIVESDCVECGESFEYYESDQREGLYCSKCRGSWNDEKQKETIEVECPSCGEAKGLKPFQFRQRKTDYCRSCYPQVQEDNPNWRGGLSEFYGENWNEVREKILQRDENCQKCGNGGSDTLLDVHHITPIKTFDEPEEANTMDNLILLCRSCHMEVERNVEVA